MVKENIYYKKITKHSKAILFFVFVFFQIFWIVNNHNALFNKYLQIDDARIHLYYFHSYAGNTAFDNDPVVQEVSKMMTPGVRFLYKNLVPYFGLLTSIKIVQGLTFVLIIMASWYIHLKKKELLPQIFILLIFTLSTPYLVNSAFGGLQRSFWLPCFYMWILGILSQVHSVRYFSVILACLTYPVIGVLIIACETIYLLLSFLTFSFSTRTRNDFISYMTVATLAFVILLPQAYFMSQKNGQLHNYDQAMSNPALGPKGRVHVVPFQNPIPNIARILITPIYPREKISQFITNTTNNFNILKYVFISLICILMLYLFKKKYIQIPLLTITIFIASLTLFYLARLFAFKLYVPDRYLGFGLPFVFIVLLIEVFAKKSKNNNLVAIVIFACLFVVTGISNQSEKGYFIDGQKNDKLYEYINNEIPVNSRILCHPNDADNIPLFAGRATTIGYETLQPWYVNSWSVLKEQTKDILKVLYTTDTKNFISYCNKNDITHVLINSKRYSKNIIYNSKLFEPFDSYMHKLLCNMNYKELLLYKILNNNYYEFKNDNFIIYRIKNIKDINI